MTATTLSIMQAQSVEPPNERLVNPKQEGAYHTIQAALDDALPGETVTIAGGVYNEHLVTRRAGLPGRPITVRAAPNQIVLIRPGLPHSGCPRAVDNLPNVFCWSNAGLAEAAAADTAAFWEANTRLRLKRVYSPGVCEMRLGSWYYDEERDDLYIRSTGIAPSSDLIYIREEVVHPVFSVKHAFITIENLAFAFGAHGVEIDRTSHVTVRNCHAWCNRSAGIYVHGDYVTLADNVVNHNNQYGIQMRHSVNYCKVLRNTAFMNGPNNGESTDSSVPADISLYSRAVYNLFEGNIIEGQHQNAYRNKYGGNNVNVFHGNVVKGFFDCSARCIENNTIIATGLGPRFGIYVDRIAPDPSPDPERCDPGGHQRRTNLIHPVIHNEDPLFADPAWRDYRLQAGSPYRDRGAFPALDNVFYVDPENGDDANHGRSAGSAFRSLSHVASIVHPGYTVYLMPGRHEGKLRMIWGGIDGQTPIRFRAYGKSDAVVLADGLAIERAGKEEVKTTSTDHFAKFGPAHIILEGLVFKGGGTRISNASNIRFSNCIWDMDEDIALKLENCDSVKLDRCTFVGNANSIFLRNAANTTIARSLFCGRSNVLDADEDSLETLQSYYNAWSRADWQLNGASVTSLEDWNNAVTAACGDLIQSVSLSDNYTLPLESPLMFDADDFGFIGARSAPPGDLLEIRSLLVAGLTPDTASIQWETPRGLTESVVTLRDQQGGTRTVRPVDTIQVFGEYFDMSGRADAFYHAGRHLALGDLEAGQTYEVEVTARSAGGTAENSSTLRFVTPAAAPEPRTLHVSPEGSDEADGLTPESAWRTLRKASSSAAPGDRVRVWPGVYAETLRPRVSGAPGKPIIFESVEPRQARIDLMENLPVAVEILNVDHVEVIGFSVFNTKFPRGRVYTIANARGIRLAGNEIRYPAKATFERMVLGHSGLIAVDAPGLILEDNVFLCAAYAIGLARCSGAQIRHNTILGEGNYGISIVPDAPEEVYVIENNLFERPVMDYKTGSAIWMFNVKAILKSDYNLYHIPATHKGTIGMILDQVSATLAEWQQASGQDQHSLEAQPLFRDPAAGDFRLRPESPGINVGSQGDNIGIRWQ